jgi:hypothetical protein
MSMSSRATRVLARIGLGLTAVIALVLATRAVFNYSYGRKLESYLAGLKASGAPVTLEDLEPACPAGDNGAPFWKAAAAVLILENEDKAVLTKALPALRSRTIPGPDIVSELAPILAKNQKALQLMREASGKPCFKEEAAWKSQHDEALASDAVKMIGAARLLSLEAVLKAERGSAEEAAAECLEGLRLMRKGLTDAFLINDLVLMAGAKQLVIALQVVVSGRDLPVPLLARAIVDLDGAAWHDGMIRALRTERVLGRLRGLRAIRGGEGGLWPWLVRPILKSEMIWASTVWDRVIREAERPYFEKDGLTQFWTDIEEKTPRLFRAAGMMIPNVATFALKEATLEAFLAATRLGIACKIYRSRHGVLPRALADLVPDLLPSLPIDPFTGRPFIYKEADSGVTIYSLGSNKEDDGGRETWEITKIVMDKDDDWSWRERGASPGSRGF